MSVGDFSIREKLILSGLYLAKYDDLGLQKLGFESFQEAFNVIGYALGSRPASIKNYRDEFDPLFPNSRRGWHKRKTRDYCLVVYERYKDLGFEVFAAVITSFFFEDELRVAESSSNTEEELGSPSFAQRLITGLAAEAYFQSIHPTLSEFQGRLLENTTQLGCGYDFRLRADAGDREYLAIEVKGIRERSGALSMTTKEHDVALALRDRFFLFVVRNFRELPFHDIFRNPLAGTLAFKRVERIVVQTSWSTTV